MSMDEINDRMRILERIQFVTTRQKARVAERAKLMEATRKLDEADREDEAELGRLFKNLTGSEVGSSVSTPTSEEDVAEDLGIQDLVIALMHKYEGESFDVHYAMKAIYPNDENGKAYKKIYGTLDAMERAKKATKLDGGKARWKPLQPRDPRPIRFPNGDILEALTLPPP